MSLSKNKTSKPLAGLMFLVACYALCACSESTPTQDPTPPPDPQATIAFIVGELNRTNLIGYWTYDATAHTLSAVATESRDRLQKRCIQEKSSGLVVFEQSPEHIYQFDAQGKTVTVNTLQDGRYACVFANGDVFVY